MLLAAVPAGAVTRTGVLQVAHGHEAGSWRSTHVARLAGVRLDLRRAGRPGALAHRFGGRRVRVTGVMRGGALRVRSMRRARGRATARAAHALSGSKTAAVILFGFSGGPVATRTVADVRTAFFTGGTSLRAYIEEISGGRSTVTGLAGNSDGDVVGPLTIAPSAGKAPSDGACQEFHWMSLARQAAIAAGTNVDQYDRIMYLSADALPCDFAGEAPISSSPMGKGTWIYLNDAISTRVAAHEWGHTFGLMHAAATRCRGGGGANVAISSSCTDTEYGDPFDTMGMGSARWFQAFNRVSLGMLPAATGVATAWATGQYILGALPQSSAGVRLLKVPRGDGTYLGLELRKPYGLFETWTASAPVVNGVTVRILPGSYDCCDEPLTRLVDAHPSTTTFTDAPLAIGESLTDPLSGATISVASAGIDSATVAVTHPGADPGADPDPDPVTPPATTPSPPTTTPPPPTTPTSTTVPPPPTPGSTTATTTTVAEVVKPAALRVALLRRATRSVLIRVRPGLAGPWTIRATVRRGGRTLAARTIRNVRTAWTALRLASRSRMRRATLAVTVTSAAGRQQLRRRL